MIFCQRIETCCSDSGHTEKEEQAFEQRVKLVLQARILVAEDKDDDDNGSKTEGDRETRSQDYQRDGRQWTHLLISEAVHKDCKTVVNYDESALDPRTQEH